MYTSFPFLSDEDLDLRLSRPSFDTQGIVQILAWLLTRHCLDSMTRRASTASRRTLRAHNHFRSLACGEERGGTKVHLSRGYT